jgi:hypothetical protein
MKGSHVNHLKSLISFVVPLLQFVKVAKHLTGCNSISELHLVPRLVLLPVVYLMKTYALLYPLSLFMLLSWNDCYRVIIITCNNFLCCYIPLSYMTGTLLTMRFLIFHGPTAIGELITSLTCSIIIIVG